MSLQKGLNLEIHNFKTISIFYNKQFLPHIYSSGRSISIDGNIKIFTLLINTKYLDGKPVLLFTEQTQEIENGKQEMGKELISNSQFPIPSIVFKDSTPEDLALELVENGKWKMGNGEWKIKETEGKGSYLKWQKKFRIEKAGVYEIWIENGKREMGNGKWKMGNGKWEMGNGKWGIKVDGGELAHSLNIALSSSLIAHSQNRKYIKVGEVEMSEGEHKIEAHSSSLLAHSKNIKIVLVNKEEREKLEKEIWQRINQSNTELCYIFEKEEGEFCIP